MPGQVTLDDQAETLRRPESEMTARERATEIAVALGFLLAAGGLVLARPPGSFSAVPAIVCFAVFVAATRIRIDTPFGATVPTQLAFVPLIFVLPVSVVPFAVAAAMTGVRLMEVIEGDVSPSRLVEALGNSWFALGPALVFELANIAPSRAGALVLVAALAAQIGADFASGTLRFCVGLPGGALLRASFSAQLWFYVVDVCALDAWLTSRGARRAEPDCGARSPSVARPALVIRT